MNIQSLYQQYATAIFAYVQRKIPSREDAEDLLLEIFLTAIESASFHQLPEDKQPAWLYRVAHNKIIDRYRHEARRQFIALDEVTDMLFDDEELAPEQIALRKEEYAQLQIVIKRLPEVQQEILRLRFANGLRFTEIATILGKRESTVRTMLCRTLNLLRTIYREEVKV